MTIAAVPPMLQHEGEFTQLLELYRERRPRRVLEVGVGDGGSLYHWLHEAEAGTVVVAVDDRHTNLASYQDWTRINVALLTVTGDSHDPRTVEYVGRHGPYDWVFIDADHHEPAVRDDWRNYGAMVAAGGAVAFHDITPARDATIEVDRLWGELRAELETVEFVQLTDACGIGVVLMPEGDA